jgi:hypothetical protein
MKDKRVRLALLVLLVLLIGWLWKCLTAVNHAPVASVEDKAVGKKSVVAAPKPVQVDSVETPTTPAVRASQSPETGSVNDWGVIEFTDGVPVVRTLSTGELCVIVPTIFDLNGIRQISLKMLIEAPGSLTMPAAAIEALRGLDAQTFINQEHTAARTDPTKVILSSPAVTAEAGTPVAINVGGRDKAGSLHFSFTPIPSATQAGGDAPLGKASPR